MPEPVPVRDFATELLTMPTSRLLVLITYRNELRVWALGIPISVLPVAGDDERWFDPIMRARVAVVAEVDRRFPIPGVTQ